MVCLQSGEEEENTRRQGAEAFGLAERQDQLLEDASARLELLNDESRSVRKTCTRTDCTVPWVALRANHGRSHDHAS